MNKAFRWLAIFIVTLALCAAGSAPVFVLGLVVHEFVSDSLALLVMGLLAALTSSWMSNLLSGDSTHSRILRIAGVTEIVAVLLVPFRVVFYILQPGANIVLFAAWSIVISVAACLAAARFRSRAHNRKRDIVTTLVLLALAPAVVVASVFVASLFGLTGA